MKSRRMVSLEKTLSRGLVDIIGTAERLPFFDDRFDVVICTDTLQYIPNPALAIEEMHRVLRPKGKLFLSTREAYPEHHDEYWRFLPNGLRHLTRRFVSVGIVPEGYSGSGLMIAMNVLLHRNIRSALIKECYSRTSVPLINKVGSFIDQFIHKDTRYACGVSLMAIK